MNKSHLQIQLVIMNTGMFNVVMLCYRNNKY